jgi:flagellum-specific peptidoglycan hydrolase FlgJ
MTENQVPDLITPLRVPDLYVALGAAWRDEFNTVPARRSLLIVLAQWAEETGRGAACHNWNLGNVRHVDGDGCDWFELRVWENVHGTKVWGIGRFRAFGSLDEGARAHLRFLREHYASAWLAVLTGSPADFVHMCKMHGYFTGDEGDYTRAVVSLVAEFDRALPPDATTTTPTA